MALSIGTRNYLARRWYMDELGRPPTAAEQADRAKIIDTFGVDAAYAGIYDSTEAKAYRKRVGRTV